MKLIDKSSLLSKIEKLKGKVSDGSSYCNGWQHALRMLELSLNTLEVKDEFESGAIEERRENPTEFVKGFMSGSKWKTNKLERWLKSESDFLLEECRAGRGDLAKQYRGELYKEIIAKLKDMEDTEDS